MTDDRYATKGNWIDKLDERDEKNYRVLRLFNEAFRHANMIRLGQSHCFVDRITNLRRDGKVTRLDDRLKTKSCLYVSINDMDAIFNLTLEPTFQRFLSRVWITKQPWKRT